MLRAINMKAVLLSLVGMVILSLSLPAQGFSLAAEAETGVVKVFHHSYRLGAVADGATQFDFVNQGGQEILFPFERYSLEAKLGSRNFVRLLYQPLLLETEVGFRDDVTIDGITFPSGTPMSLTYSFPFWRLSWIFRIIDGPFSLDAGAALQLRNASVRFARLDGTGGISVTQNLGPVPAVILRTGWEPVEGFRIDFDATGLWASSAIINGADFNFEGSILDASLRAGKELRPGIEAFLNLRFLGGTASGISGYDRTAWTESVSPETDNSLATGTLSAGFRVDPSFISF